jgi:hypothetical protein
MSLIPLPQILSDFQGGIARKCCPTSRDALPQNLSDFQEQGIAALPQAGLFESLIAATQ